MQWLVRNKVCPLCKHPIDEKVEREIRTSDKQQKMTQEVQEEEEENNVVTLEHN